jgi:putative phosphoribosyl transferase
MPDEATIQVERGQVIAADVGGEEELGVVVFAHGSGSSRHSPRNRQVAEVLQESGFQTILVDLLTENEEQTDRQTREHRFDIDLLTGRVLTTIEWLRAQVPDAPLGLFGASTGAAAALRASAAKPEETKAVVSRGGRPDMAGEALTEVESPTLLIVGGNDPQVLQFNESALAELNEASSLEVVPGASHLFEEPGTLDQVAHLAAEWFRRHLGAST